MMAACTAGAPQLGASVQRSQYALLQVPSLEIPKDSQVQRKAMPSWLPGKPHHQGLLLHYPLTLGLQSHRAPLQFLLPKNVTSDPQWISSCPMAPNSYSILDSFGML